MNYENYETSLVIGRKVMIVGWPASVPFASPSKIGNIGDMRTLHDAWLTGATRWQRMSKAAVKEHAADMEAREATGDFVQKKRKRRSDAGTKKPKAAVIVDSDENAAEVEVPPKKKSKAKKLAKTQMPPVNQSRSEGDDIQDDGGFGDTPGASGSGSTGVGGSV